MSKASHAEHPGAPSGSASPLTADGSTPVPVQPEDVVGRIPLSAAIPLRQSSSTKSACTSEDACRNCDPIASTTAEQLAGKEYLEPAMQRRPAMAGRCIAHMVAGHLLPLKLVEGKHEYPAACTD